jgi:isopenicillin N synthase-like dioxygenase
VDNSKNISSDYVIIFIIVYTGLDKEFFGERHNFMFKAAEKNRTIFRTLFYPSLADTETLAGVVRCGLHSDYGTITLLLQDDMGGLEVTHFKKASFNC